MVVRFKLVVLGLFCMLGASAQVTNEGDPLSWSLSKSSKKSIVPLLMKSPDLRKIRIEDAKNDLDKSIPWRFGYEIKVDYGLKNSGVWDELPNGDRIWRINFISTGAKTINFIFDTYKIPRGATVYLYNNDKSDLLGAYTNIFNRPDEMLGTWLVQGDNVWIEYYEPASVTGQGELNISKLIHGYRSITDAEIQRKDLGSSGDCNQDVDCSVGEDFDSLKERLKHSVGFIVMQGFVCTGALINNTRNDKAPYFLTANHCNAGSESTWTFRFNWISPNPSCATTTGSSDALINQTTSGATLLASNPESDFRLLNLDGGLDTNWDLEWAGWDRSNIAPRFAVGIHHPNGDIMKICRDNDELSSIKTTIGGIPLPIDSWRVSDWDLGVTEKGSSGSPLFSPEGRVIGQLSGGGAACVGTGDNGQPDYYGRFDISWDFGTTNTNRLSNWLDPDNTRRRTLDMLSQENIGVTPTVEKEVIVYYNPSTAKLTISNTIDGDFEYFIYSITGKRLGSGKLLEENEDVDMGGRSTGMYFVHIKNISNNNSITKKIIINQ